MSKKIFNWIWAVKNGVSQVNPNWVKKISKKLKKEINIKDIEKSSNINLHAITKDQTN